MEVKSFEFNPFAENTYILFDETRECVVIDPGCYEKDEQQALISFIQDNQLTVSQVINTHCHIDHVLGNAFVKDYFKVDLLLNRIEEPLLRAVKTYAPNYGFNRYQDSEPDKFIDENDKITFGKQTLDILFVPGHSPGHLAFYHAETKTLIGGDVLFQNSIGRTDLYGGDYDTLIESIHTKLFALPDEVTVYPGHGPTTTIGFEKKTNPFCAITH
jgi:glyoxylase-like metal-dependent hydrolase (beta-lactamase superfamily II)